MLLVTYYAFNYAGIIGRGLLDGNNKNWYQITYSQVYWSFDSVRPVYPIKFLLLQTIMIEVSFIVIWPLFQIPKSNQMAIK